MDVIKKHKNLFLLLALCLYCVDPLAIWMLGQGIVFPDFRSFYMAGLSVLTAVNPYDITQVTELAQSIKLSGYIYPYLYPPIFAVVLQPISALPPVLSAIFWLLINSALLCGIFIFIFHWLSLKSVDSASRRLPVSLLLFFILCLPFHGNLQMGQVNLFVLFCLLLSFYFSQQKSFYKSGFFLAVASLIKVTPAGFLVFFLFSRQFKVITAFLLSLLGVIALFYPLGADGELWRNFFQSVVSTMNNDVTGLSLKTQIFNYSLIQSLSRLVDDPLYLYAIYFLLVLLMSSIALVLTVKLRGEKKWFVLMLYCLLMILLPPITYTHHLVYLLPGLLFFYRYLISCCSRKVLVGFSLLLLMSCIDFPVWYQSKGVTQAWMHSINCYLLLLMYFLTAFLLLRYCYRGESNDARDDTCLG